MTQTILAYSCGLALFLTTAAHANIDVRFSEGAPKDRFTISNQGSCTLKDVTIDLDLSKSQGKLIFDITAAGAGVEVFQPFEVTEGKLKLAPNSQVNDGDSKMSLSIESLDPGGRASFTIDVDDTLPVSALGMIRVAGSEIEGGTVTVKVGEMKPKVASFNASSNATVLLSPCPQ